MKNELNLFKIITTFFLFIIIAGIAFTFISKKTAEEQYNTLHFVDQLQTINLKLQKEIGTILYTKSFDELVKLQKEYSTVFLKLENSLNKLKLTNEIKENISTLQKSEKIFIENVNNYKSISGLLNNSLSYIIELKTLMYKTPDYPLEKKEFLNSMTDNLMQIQINYTDYYVTLQMKNEQLYKWENKTFEEYLFFKHMELILETFKNMELLHKNIEELNIQSNLDKVYNFVIQNFQNENDKNNLITYTLYTLIIILTFIVGYLFILDQKQKKELQGWVKKLEDKVHERTQKLEIAVEDAQKANEAKSAFLANMSHEIRTPLNGVMGIIDIVLSSSLTQKQRNYLQKAKISSKSLLYVINDILDFSKIEAGKLDIEKREFSLNETVDIVKDTFEHTARQKGLKLYIKCEESLHLLGDNLRIIQILTNLISNAIKFTSEGSVTLNIYALEKNSTHITLQFEVIDTGIGISDEVQKNLFKEFTQADSSTTRKFGGTGLGLAISKKLVNLMNGYIGIESKENEGSKFYFYLNFEIVSNPKSDIDNKNQYEEKRLKDKHILIVEDNEINQVVVDGLLEKTELSYDFANNGKKGVDMFNNKHYDLILMDIQMPVMSGLEASKEIRKTNKQIPIIALTAGVMKEDIDNVKEAGMNDYLSKPINFEKLIETLNKHLT
jgi:signal transduction histidine kinase/CheY-like chemotaxis protein